MPVLERLPFLFADREAPAATSTPVAAAGGAGLVRLTWSYGSETDVAGYRVYRAGASGGPYTTVGPFLDRTTLVDKEPRGTVSYCVVRAVDTSGNVSDPSQEISATAP